MEEKYICSGCDEGIEEKVLLYGLMDGEVIFFHDNMIPEVKVSCPYKYKEKTGKDIIWRVTGVKYLGELIEKVEQVLSGTPIEEIVKYDHKSIAKGGEYEEAKKMIKTVEEILSEISG